MAFHQSENSESLCGGAAFARPDYDRAMRQGAGEVIYGEGKTAEQIAAIASSLMGAGQPRVLATRVDAVAGEVGVKLPKVVRVPEGETYVATEAPLGRAGWWLVSRGDKVPWRLKLRTPSFANLAALEEVLPGTPATALPLAVASFGYVVGDVAK